MASSSYQSTNIILNSILWDNLESDITPTLTSKQIYLDTTQEVVLLTNSCLDGLTNTASGNIGGQSAVRG